MSCFEMIIAVTTNNKLVTGDVPKQSGTDKVVPLFLKSLRPTLETFHSRAGD